MRLTYLVSKGENYTFWNWWFTYIIDRYIYTYVCVCVCCTLCIYLYRNKTLDKVLNFAEHFEIEKVFCVHSSAMLMFFH